MAAVSPPRAPLPGLRRLRLVMVTVLVVTAFVRVVVGRRLGADLLLEAREGDAVDAHVAVHADVPGQSLCGTLDHKVSYSSGWPEVSCVAHLDAGVRQGECFALPADTLLEDAGKQEVGEDHDVPGAEFEAAIQPFRNVGLRHADVSTLDYGVRASLVEQAGYLDRKSV